MSSLGKIIAIKRLIFHSLLLQYSSSPLRLPLSVYSARNCVSNEITNSIDLNSMLTLSILSLILRFAAFSSPFTGITTGKFLHHNCID